MLLLNLIQYKVNGLLREDGRLSRLKIFYRPQTKFAKAMFLQVSVCPHWGGAYVVLFGGACVVLFGGCAWFYLGGHMWFYSGGVHGFIRGACAVLFGGHAWFYSGGMRGFIQGDMCGFIWGGACMVFSVFSDTIRYGQWAGGTHPTGMHSCLIWFRTNVRCIEWCGRSNFHSLRISKMPYVRTLTEEQ